MATLKTYRTKNQEGQPLVLLNYVTNISDEAITNSEIDSVTYRVFQYDTLEDAISETDKTEVGEEAAENAVYTSLFKLGQVGQRIKHLVSTVELSFLAYFPEAGFYRVELVFTPDESTGEEAFYCVWIVTVEAVASV